MLGIYERDSAVCLNHQCPKKALCERYCKSKNLLDAYTTKCKPRSKDCDLFQEKKVFVLRHKRKQHNIRFEVIGKTVYVDSKLYARELARKQWSAKLRAGYVRVR